MVENNTEVQSRYVRLSTGAKKVLRVTNWRNGIWFDKQGIGMDIVEEDGERVEKEFTVTSKRLMQEMEPILKQAQKENRKSVLISLLKTGEGFDTQYLVKELK